MRQIVFLVVLGVVGCSEEGPSGQDSRELDDPTPDGDTGDDTDLDTADTGTPQDTGGDTGVDTDDPTDTGEEPPTMTPDTGPGPDPDPDQPVAQPKWQRMWGASDLTIRLDGRASYDPTGAALTYRWSATEGTFDDDTSPTPWYTGSSGAVSLVVSSAIQTSTPVAVTVYSDEAGARIPTDYPTVDLALLAGETILFLEAGTYGPIDGAAAIIGDPNGGVTIDAAGAPNGVTGASYLRHLTVTGAVEHGVYADTDIRIHDCVIEGNGTTAVDGGGIWSSATVLLMDTVVRDNAGYLGGGIYVERNASLYAQQVIIADNNAEYGGGIYGNTTFGNVALQNTMLVGNSANINGGGGVFLDTRAFLTRVTVAGNAPGGVRLRYGYFEVAETIFGENTVYGIDVADAPTIKISDSLFGSTDIVRGGLAPDPIEGNINADPTFARFTAGSAWADQDFRLAAGSAGFDQLSKGQDRDGSAQDIGAYGGFLGRFPSGEQGTW